MVGSRMGFALLMRWRWISFDEQGRWLRALPYLCFLALVLAHLRTTNMAACIIRGWLRVSKVWLGGEAVFAVTAAGAV